MASMPPSRAEVDIGETVSEIFVQMSKWRDGTDLTGFKFPNMYHFVFWVVTKMTQHSAVTMIFGINEGSRNTLLSVSPKLAGKYQKLTIDP